MGRRMNLICSGFSLECGVVVRVVVVFCIYVRVVGATLRIGSNIVLGTA